MVIATEGAGERSVFVSYISEVPIWKTTYRLVLSSKRGPLLQGWAIVDNTVGEDWDNVQLSLVAGAPQSFIQNLSQPYYSRRPVVPLPESVNISPQTFESTLIPGGTRLSGVVTDPTGAAVAHATVKAYDSSGGVVGQTTPMRTAITNFRDWRRGLIRSRSSRQVLAARSLTAPRLQMHGRPGRTRRSKSVPLQRRWK